MADPQLVVTVDMALGLHCDECNAALQEPAREYIEEFVSGSASTCSRCGAPIDVWQNLVKQVEFGSFGLRYVAVGARALAFNVALERGEPTVLDLTTVGLPSEARIENVAATARSAPADGFLAPVFHRDPTPGQLASERLVVHGVPLPVPDLRDAASGEVSLMVVWTPPGPHDPADDLLITAVRAAERQDRLGAVVAANAAVELALEQTIDAWFSKHGIGADRRRSFLSVATYGNQLAVLLPVVCDEVGVPVLSEAPYAALQRLKRVRDNAAHGSIRAEEIPDRDLQHGLVGASVGVALAGILRAALTPEGDHEFRRNRGGQTPSRSQ